MIDKLLIEIDRTDDAVAAYEADPAGFVAEWETTTPEPPYPAGGTLTDEERRAFTTLDYGELYRLGAHPFLLWHLVRAVLVTDDLDVHEVSARYVEAVTPHGYPDFAT
jgi:hypothetical protein